MAAAAPAPHRSTPAWRQQLSAFWRWWTDEIAQLLPERFARLRGQGRVPLVAVADDGIVLVEPRSAVGPDTRVDFAALDEARRRSALRALLERAGEKRTRLRIALAPHEALVRRVTMPAATEENLDQVLGFEMDRLTPFRADEVYFDHRVVSRDAAAAQIVVQIAVARRELVDARVAALRAIGASVQGVTVRDDIGHAGAPLDLLPSEQRGERETTHERLVQRLLIGLVLLLALFALLFPVWQKRDTVIRTYPLLGKARQEAEATDALARELERAAGDYNFLLTRKHASYPALAYVEEVSRLFPDNTWVQQLDIRQSGKQREVQISGETPSSSKLIEILEQSKLMRNAATRGSVTRGAPGMERFQIGAEAATRPLPEAGSLLAATAPGAAPQAVPGAPGQPAPPPAAAAPAAAPAATPPTATVTPAPAPGKKPADAKAGAKPVPPK